MRRRKIERGKENVSVREREKEREREKIIISQININKQNSKREMDITNSILKTFF